MSPGTETLKMYEEIDRKFRAIIKKHELQEKEVSCEILARGFSDSPPNPSLTSKGITEQYFKLPSREYALTKGKEVLVRCEVEDHYGDAFTDEPKTFRGKIKETYELLFGDKGDKTIFFGMLNATLNYLGLIEKTIHCGGDEPRKCGEKLAAYILEKFGRVKVAHIGYQPGHLEACSKEFDGYVTDLNPENIGKVKFGRKILDGSANERVIRKVDVACITGSTVASGALPELLKWCNAYGVASIIYGVTSKGAAKILNFDAFCPYSREYPS